MPDTNGASRTVTIAAVTALVVTFATNAASQKAADYGGEARVIANAVDWICGAVDGYRGWVVSVLLVPMVMVLVGAGVARWRCWRPYLDGYGYQVTVRSDVGSAWRGLVLTWSIAATLVMVDREFGGIWWALAAAVVAGISLARMATSLRRGIFA